ncbi:MAG: TIGR01777 family protein [Gemmatimonadetes bacterium]|nr:TIGR01777 family protein [Gemmatimonadota bacterium]
MAHFDYRSELDAPLAEVFAWHRRPGSLERMLPPWERMRVLEWENVGVESARLVLELRRGPWRRRWVLRQREDVEGEELCLEQVDGPFEVWLHRQRFAPTPGGRTLLEDEVEYRLPPGPLGELVVGGAVRRTLQRVFRFRHARVGYDLARHGAFAAQGPLCLAVTGSTGVIGSELVAFLESGGHRVFRLVRRQPHPGAPEIHWSVEERRIDRAAIEGLDAVVHLAGASIAGGLWTPARKEVIRRSRADGTRLLCEALGALERPPRVLVAASAIGIYGDRGEELVDEESAGGVGFLADVAREWEAATEPARAAGIRVVNVRIGLVVAGNGGALAPMLPPFSLGLGGRIGNGRQFWSWIDRDDLVGVIQHVIFRDTLRGPVNAVAPEPVTNAEFAAILARVLARPAWIPLPAAAVRFVLGEMGQELLLAGARVACRKLEADGFGFLHPDLEGSLRFQLGR